MWIQLIRYSSADGWRSRVTTSQPFSSYNSKLSCFSKCFLDNVQRIFNYRLSCGRKTIACPFGNMWQKYFKYLITLHYFTLIFLFLLLFLYKDRTLKHCSKYLLNFCDALNSHLSLFYHDSLISYYFLQILNPYLTIL